MVRGAQANAIADRARIEPDLSSRIQSPASARSRDSGLTCASTTRLNQQEPTAAGPELRSVVLTQSQNWKRRPTVGSIEDLCRKPLARPFDTCDHMIPKYASKRFANL